MPLSIEAVKQKVLPILHRHRVKRAALFGSLVRDEIGEDSDIDILVEIDNDISLLDFIGIKQELEDSLERRVDLVEYDMIKPIIKDEILREQQVIL